MSEPKDLDIVILPDVQAAIDADPELAKAMRELSAAFHQAWHAVETGQHATFDDAMEAITGLRPARVTLDDGDAEPAT